MHILSGLHHQVLVAQAQRFEPDFANLTLFELDGMSFETMRGFGVFPSLTCRVVLRSCSSKRRLRLLAEDSSVMIRIGARCTSFPGCTTMSFETMRGFGVFPSLTCRVVLRCDFDDLEQTLALVKSEMAVLLEQAQTPLAGGGQLCDDPDRSQMHISTV
jgi:hypothetical protein